MGMLNACFKHGRETAWGVGLDALCWDTEAEL